MSQLLDQEGNVYRQGFLDSQWRKEQGLLGPKKDTNWLGQPNVQRNLFGEPSPARDFLGTPHVSDDGRPLYRPSSSSGFSGSGGDALAGLAAIGLLILFVIVAGAVLGLFGRLLKALFDGWRELVRRYPRAMLVVHLSLGVASVVGALRLVGFDWKVQLGGAALVPGLWGWLWLTRRLPMVFMPINALIVGCGLFLAAQWSRGTWSPTWTRLTAGLPLVGNLPWLLGSLPLAMWLWKLGASRWARLFQLFRLLVVGAMLWFLLMRIWPGWRPSWEKWIDPAPLVASFTGWLVFLFPFLFWLWLKGQARWPIPFTAFNLLLFGGLLGLTAFHTQAAWNAIWQHWMAGLPFFAAPILTISLSPVGLWGWSRVSQRWRQFFVIPNLLLTGAVLWSALDRTRETWDPAWGALWGRVPAAIDPALAVAGLPLAAWYWRWGSRRWLGYWGAARALLWGGVLWWAAERTRPGWETAWEGFLGRGAPDLALVSAVTPMLCWLWLRSRRRRRRAAGVVAWGALTLALGWLVGRLLPDSTLALRGAVALLPSATGGWFWLLRHRTLFGLALMLPFLGLGVAVWLAPDSFEPLIDHFLSWLVTQGVPVVWN